MDSEVKDLDADGESDTPSVSTGRDHLERKPLTQGFVGVCWKVCRPALRGRVMTSKVEGLMLPSFAGLAPPVVPDRVFGRRWGLKFGSAALVPSAPVGSRWLMDTVQKRLACGHMLSRMLW